MRVALISDIHGNLVSLEAVLADITRQGVDQVICLGDVAATGPQPRATLERVQELDCPVVMGNADAWLLDPRRSADADEDLQRVEVIDQWCAERLLPEHLEFIRTFEATVGLSLAQGVDLLAFHGSPRANIEIIQATTPEAELAPALEGFQATVMAGGHTHQPMIRTYGDVTLVNPGSVGLPYEEVRATGQVRNPPWAAYALLDWEAGVLSVALRRVPVSVRAVIRAALDSDMPYATFWTRGWG